jgi:hypothetical protein
MLLYRRIFVREDKKRKRKRERVRNKRRDGKEGIRLITFNNNGTKLRTEPYNKSINITFRNSKL